MLKSYNPELMILENMIATQVATSPFDNLSVLLDFLDHAEQYEKPQEAYAQWQPNSIEMIERYGGTNCVGATKKLKKEIQARALNLVTKPLRFVFNYFQYGITEQDVPYSHTALLVQDPQTQELYIADPGFGVPQLIPFDEIITVDGQKFLAKYMDKIGMLDIEKQNNKGIHFDFQVAEEDWDAELELQKPLLSVTTRFKIDIMNELGKKEGSLQIDYWNNKVVLMHEGDSVLMTFDQAISILYDDFHPQQKGRYHLDLLSEKLKRISTEYRDVLKRLIHSQDKVRSIWHEKLQQAYYLYYSQLVSPFESSWNQLQEIGYVGGGVALFILNEKNEILLYEVPPTREKPFLGRYAGQLNVFIETAEKTEVNGKTEYECFLDNFNRAVEEELGVDTKELSLTNEFYCETDYRPPEIPQKIRARCTIVHADSQIAEQVNAAHAVNNFEELGRVQWVSLESVLERNLEPNARHLLEKLIAAGRFEKTQKLVDENQTQSMKSYLESHQCR